MLVLGHNRTVRKPWCLEPIPFTERELLEGWQQGIQEGENAGILYIPTLNKAALMLGRGTRNPSSRGNSYDSDEF